MLGSHEATATIAVRPDAARQFYEASWGSSRATRRSGRSFCTRRGARRSSSTIRIRRHEQGHGRDLDRERRRRAREELQSRGVRFERYDFPGCQRAGDVHVMGSRRVAWFQDPEGNIHSLVNG